MTMAGTRENSVIGCLLGTAVGDSVGLSCEGMSKRRQRQVYPEINGHHFVFRKGMISDDTEHACMVAQALIVSGGDVETFAKSLAWRFRFWLLGLPAGIGYATLRAILKLWLGFPSHRSGVFSAGNGPVMRSAVLGVCYGHDTRTLRDLVTVSTRMTHTDPKAEFGALAVALAAFMAGRGSEKEVSPGEYYHTVQRVLGTEANDFLQLIHKTVTSVETRQSTESFAENLGLSEGISGYVYHTVPVVLHAWLRNQSDYRSAIIVVAIQTRRLRF
jgi:ADP-ribosylglycohydrolase